MGFGSSPAPPAPPPPPPSQVSPEMLERRRRARRELRSPRSETLLTSPLGLTSRGSISIPSLIGGTPQGGQGS